MSQTVRHLTRHCDVHLVALLDYPHEREAHAELDRICASTQYIVRMEPHSSALASLAPHAVREFWSRDLEWVIHRTIFTHRIDVLQIEYTNMGQYRGEYRQIVNALFEHDVYFQSISRGLAQSSGLLARAAPAFEYLRALRYELRMLDGIDHIQVCSNANREYLASFAPALTPRIHSGLRAGIDTRCYRPTYDGREPFTMLFLGSFRHLPNQTALTWFLNGVLPRIREGCPQARLVIVGAEPPPAHAFGAHGDAIELRGFVEDIHEPLERYAVFVCPILNGSGVRVKLLEAFASGIPCVSTSIGAEGLSERDGEVCLLRNEPEEFARGILTLFQQPEQARQLAERARCQVEQDWDMSVITERLAHHYRAEIERKRATSSQDLS